jgi:uncharacterized protein YcfJ
MASERETKHSPFNEDRDRTAENRDPITGAPGSHPVGVGVGAAGGASAGAAIGAVVGPVGAAVGAAIGGVAGGLLGKGVAEGVNPTDEHAYWEQNYRHRPYYQEGRDYTVYGPAYQYGWESRSRHTDRAFEEVEAELQRDWEAHRGERDLEWEHARNAARDAWERTGRRNT